MSILTRGYGDPSARESRRESSSSPIMSPSVKSSTLSGTGRDTDSGDGSRLAAGSELGRPFASESECKGDSPSLTGMEVATGAGRHCRSIEQSAMEKKQTQSVTQEGASRAQPGKANTSNHKHQSMSSLQRGGALVCFYSLIFALSLQWLTDSWNMPYRPATGVSSSNQTTTKPLLTSYCPGHSKFRRPRAHNPIPLEPTTWCFL